MNSRSANSFINIASGMIGKTLLLLAAFTVRTVFIRTLGMEYNGLNGVFGNILNILSLSDLGINGVFSYFLYQAICSEDEERLSGTVFMFKRYYIIIGCFVSLLGLIIVPFLPSIINTSIPIEEAIKYYILFLVNSCVSYFFSYKTILLVANQKQVYENVVTTILQIILYVAQSVYVIHTHDYTGFLLLQIIFTISKNIILTTVANKKYPFLKNSPKSFRNEEQLKLQLKEKVKGTFIYRICLGFINHTDNILISILVGTVYVGIYSNYTLIVGYIDAYIYVVTQGVVASIGVFNASVDKDKSFRVYKELLFLYLIIAALVVNVFATCIQAFIPIWIGKEYLLGTHSLMAILLVQYLQIICTPSRMFRETKGYFAEVKHIVIIAVISNIILSVIGGKEYGISGILIATFISKLVTLFWYEPNILFTRWFQRPLILFFKKTGFFSLVSILCLTINLFLCRHISTSLMGCIIRAVLSGIITIAIIAIFYFKTDEFTSLLIRLKWIVYKIKNRITVKG